MKRWHKLLFGSLDMAVVNSYVVRNASKKQQLLFLEFRRETLLWVCLLVHLLEAADLLVFQKSVK